MINTSETKIAKISELSSAPVLVHVHSNKQTEHVSAGLVDMQEQIIQVADLNGRMYIIDGHMLVEAHRKRGKKTVRVKIYKVKNIREVLTLHVKHNLNNPPSPIQLIRIILYMRKCGDTDKEIAKALKVSKFVTNMLRLKINEDAVKELESILKDVSKLYYSVHHSFPQNLIEWIFRQPEGDQHAATIALRSSIGITSSVTERKFTWPTTIEVRVVQKHSATNQTEKVKPVPLMFDNEGMRGRPRNTIVGSSITSKPPSEEEISKIGDDNTPTSRRKLAFKCPHGSLMYIDGKSRVYNVEDDDRNEVVHLRHIDVEDDVYKLSRKCSDFMHVKNGKIFLKMCTPVQVAKHLSNLKKKKANVCILSSTEL